MSFPRKQRLKKQKDFDLVFADPLKVTHKSLVILYQTNHLPWGRLGLILAKHHMPRAVDRNKLRRLLRAHFIYNKESIKGLDLLVLLRSKCSPQPRGERGNDIREDIDFLWQKLLKTLSARV